MRTHVYTYTDRSSDAAARKKVGAGLTSALAMAKHFQGRWLRVRCQATTGRNLLLCIKLLDSSTHRHDPFPTSPFLQTESLLSEACSYSESRWKETHSTFFVTCKVAVQWTPAHCGLAADWSSPIWRSLTERPKLWSSS